MSTCGPKKVVSGSSSDRLVTWNMKGFTRTWRQKEIIGALWHSHIGRRGEAVCAETSLGLLLHRDLQAGSISASEITAVGLLWFNLLVAITILLRGYSSLVLSKPNLSWAVSLVLMLK